MTPHLSFHALFRDEIDRYSRKANHRSDAPLLRLEREIALEAGLIDTVAACGAAEKFYFRAKDEPFELAGLGSAQVVAAERPDDVRERFRRLWEADPLIPVFGGFSFDGGVSAPEWHPFGGYRFTLPLVELRRTGRGVTAAVNRLRQAGESTEEALAAISAALNALDAARRTAPRGRDRAAAVTRETVPARPEWNRMVRHALDSIRAGELQKIVLARKVVIRRTGGWDPAELLAALAGIGEESFTFCYQPDDGAAFLGRSPERLFRIREGRIIAEAIAGTRPRGETQAEDRRLAAELLESQKELEEHRVVAGFVEAGMERICTEVRRSASEEILKLKNVQHIVTRFVGRLAGEASPLSIAGLFHPTPAVGGYPRDGILPYLRQQEPFRRGWFGAPIGWMNRSDADFAVGIRSALLSGNELHIFAGAGIVGRSNAGDEWNETEQKMDNFTAILGERPCQ